MDQRVLLESFFDYINNGEREGLPKDSFFEFLRTNFLDVTFEDVKLKTLHSDIVPKDVSVSSYFSRNVPLNVPIVSSPMDTVTEEKMAIAMAKSGGLGIIHKNLTPAQQKDQVKKVKLNLSARIERPICVFSNQTVEEVLNMKEEKEYTFDTFTVIERDTKKLVGVITKNDFDFCKNTSQKVSEIMTREVLTLRTNATLDEAYTLMEKNKIKMVPLVDESNLVSGLYILKDIKRVKFGEYEIYNTDSKGRLRVGAAIGVNIEDALKRINLMKEFADVFVLDAAHADTKSMLEALIEIKRIHPSIDVVIGNVTEKESAKRLIESGADGIKVGQGPGSICTTRIISGVGKPQISAIYECSLIADYHKVPIIADGGIKYSGDISVAIGAGAMSVMLGSLLAGTKESPGEERIIGGRKFKTYRGMGSIAAMAKNRSSKERYNQEDIKNEKLVPEGVEGIVPYIGEVRDVMIQYVGGLKSGMGYVGAKNIQDLRKKANFNRQTPAGAKEAHPSIQITNEAPNYSPQQ